MRELTIRGVVLGALITVVFTGANLSMGLRTGVTFSSSIPAAVISMALLRALGGGSILENNAVQTQASAAGTLCNVILVLPALAITGLWHGFPFWQTTGVCLAGGLLGVLFSVPFRRALVADGDLPFPEGIAAAAVLQAGHGGDEGRSGVRDLAAAGVAAGGFGLLTGTGLLGGAITGTMAAGNAVLRGGIAFSPALTGVGYLVGIGCCLALALGLLVAWGVAVPALGLLTGRAAGETAAALAERLWSGQVRLIGAGVIAAASVWTVGRLLGPVWAAVRAAWQAAADRRGGAVAERTERDLPIAVVGWGALGLAIPLGVLVAAAAREGGWDAGTGALIGFAMATAAFTVVFGFLMAAACGYMAGLLGSSSSPVSGIGILAAIATALPLSHLGAGRAMSAALMGTALVVTALVVTISSIANDNLQDLKTGRLLGATPWRQQLALGIGVVAGSVVVAPVLQVLYQAYGFAGSLPRAGMDTAAAMAAPQASLVASIAKGIFSHTLPWGMVVLGLGLGVVLVVVEERLRAGGRRFPALSVGIGIYLPPTVVAAIAAGGAIGWVAEQLARRRGIMPDDDTGGRLRRRGVLGASGFLVGESVAGLVLAGREVLGGHATAATGGTATAIGLAVFAILLALFFRAVSVPRLLK